MYILQKILEKCKNILKKDRKLQKIYKEGLKITAMIAILFENQIQTTSASPYRTQVQPVASFLVCSLIFIEYKVQQDKEKPRSFFLGFAYYEVLTFYASRVD